MRVTVRYFAVVREVLGQDHEEHELPEGTTVGQFLDNLITRQPILEGLRRSMLVMVNRRYAKPDQLLSDGDEVALIPPVSGGSTPSPLALNHSTQSLLSALWPTREPGRS